MTGLGYFGLRIADFGLKETDLGPGLDSGNQICASAKTPKSAIRNPQSANCLFLLFISLGLLAGCAKTGEPQPPLFVVPKPSADLAARQFGYQIVLTVTLPLENANGTRVTALKRVEVFRRTETRRGSTAPLPAMEFINRADRLISVEQDKIADYLQDKILVFRDDSALSDRSLISSRAFRYAIVFVNKKDQSAGIGNQAFIAPIVMPLPPTDLRAEASQEAIRLQWTEPAGTVEGSKPMKFAGHNVYRSEDRGKFPSMPLNSQPLAKPEFLDRDFQFDKTYYYAASVVASLENPYAESVRSPILDVTPRDTFAPGPPSRLDLVLDNGVVILLWTAPSEKDVAGYRVYRKEVGAASREVLQQELLKALSYRDAGTRPGRKYTYQVTTVDTHGNEGAAAEISMEVP